MNLVQIAEDLKGLPLQALQGYMNGANPSVPPYLAAAEMQRRQAAAQKQQMAQGAAQGKAPSIKEQLDQAAATMNANAQRQQQGIQQLLQRAGGASAEVPERIPQPEAQPQPPEMAAGGIVNLPVRASMFRDGGVVGYVNGGSPQYLTDEEREAELRRLLGAYPSPEASAPAATVPAQVAPTEDAMTSKALYQAVLDSINRSPETVTPESVMATQRELERGAGMDELKTLREKMKADYEESKKDRYMENIIRTLSGKGTGLGGLAQGYLESQDANRAADTKFSQYMADMLGSEVGAKHRAYTGAYDTATAARNRQLEGKDTARLDLYRSLLNAETQRDYQQAMLGQAAIKAAGGAGDAKLDKSVLDSQLKAVDSEVREIQSNPQRAYSNEGRARLSELSQQRARISQLLDEIRLRSGPSTGAVASAGASGASGAVPTTAAKPDGAPTAAYTMSALRAKAKAQGLNPSDAELLQAARLRGVQVVPG